MRNDMRKNHWCIKEDCGHGTLNGSIELGSEFIKEYNKGYEQGYKDAQQDLEEGRNEKGVDMNAGYRKLTE
jgi:hypothetical protein